jgi:hypothetical protein
VILDPVPEGKGQNPLRESVVDEPSLRGIEWLPFQDLPVHRTPVFPWPVEPQFHGMFRAKIVVVEPGRFTGRHQGNRHRSVGCVVKGFHGSREGRILRSPYGPFKPMCGNQSIQSASLNTLFEQQKEDIFTSGVRSQCL